MNRTGYQIEKFSFELNEWTTISNIYMSKKEAEINMSALSWLKMRISEVTVVDSYESIDEALDTIEREHPDYQAILSAALEEVQTDIDNPTVVEENEFQNSDGSIKKGRVSEWLNSLTEKDFENMSNLIWNSAQPEKVDWLHKISICGED